MKRIVAFTLTLLLVFALVACSSEGDESSVTLQTSEGDKTESSVTENSEDASTDEESSAVSEAESTVVDTSKEESSIAPESSESENETAPDYIASFISFGVVDTKVNATSQNSLRLTGIDVEPTYGAIVLYTSDYGDVDGEELTDFAVATFTYNHEVFGYVMTSFDAVGASDGFKAPEDGFAVAIHKAQDSYIQKTSALSKTETVFPHGIHLYDGADYKISKVKTAPTIDGVFNKSEWKDHHIEDVNAENLNWSYAQFETNNYYATASYYVAYDDEYLYLCVVVDSPYHYCPITQSNATDMWQYECIQAKISSESPAGEYILENFDRATNKTAENDGVIRNFGFAATDGGETAYYQSGTSAETFEGQVVCSRDDANAITVYEVAIPFASIGVTPEKGVDIGFTFSINSTNDVDKVWKNITYRNGGGIIGRNDWTKIPVVTLD